MIPDKCPICKRTFKDEACPHSVGDVYRRQDEDKIRSIVRDEIKKWENRNAKRAI